MQEIEKNLFVRRFTETVSRMDMFLYEELKNRFALLNDDDRDAAVLDILILLWRGDKNDIERKAV